MIGSSRCDRTGSFDVMRQTASIGHANILRAGGSIIKLHGKGVLKIG